MTAATLEVDVPQGLERLVLLNAGEVAHRYGRRVPEVYAALRDGLIKGHKVGAWSWIIFQHELPECWPNPYLD